VGTPLATSATLRQAFEEAIDREALNRVVFNGADQPSCTMIAPTNTVWYSATRVPCTPFDPRDARKLVAASGVAHPTVRLLTMPAATSVGLAEFIQAQEAAVGINVVIDTADTATFLQRLMSGNFDTALGGRSPGVPDPDGMISLFLASSGVRN